MILGARTSSSATRRQSRKIWFASLIADEDVRVPSINYFAPALNEYKALRVRM